MVKIIDYRKHENSAGITFFSLILQGGIFMVQSQETGMYYATSHNASVTSTFDEETCKGLIGMELPGSVVKTPCDPYEYVVEETGETMVLNHRWVYLPEQVTIEQMVYNDEVEKPLNQKEFIV
jgi:hypothetical protein